MSILDTIYFYLKRPLILTIGGILLSLYLFLAVDPGGWSAERRIYSYYAMSLAEDLDFNVVNQIPKKEAWLLTTTLNYPDMHSNGTAVLWAPFFYFAKWFSTFTNVNSDVLYRTTQALLNVFWGLLAISLLWKLLRVVFSATLSLQTLLILLFCSPFYWFLLFQPDNADITSLFLATGLLIFYLYRRHLKMNTFSFFFGLSLFAVTAVKFDTIFYGIFFLHYLYETRADGIKGTINKVLSFCIGALLLTIPILLNETIKNGYFTYTYIDMVTSHIYLLYDNLFAPSGYFTTHPFFAVLMIVFVLLALQNRVEPIFWVCLAFPIGIVALESFSYLHNEAFGPRHWINSLPCFALVLAKVLSLLSNRRVKLLFFALCGISAFISMWSSLVYTFDFNSYFFSMNRFSILQPHFSPFSFLFSLHWINEKLMAFPILILLMLLSVIARRAIIKMDHPKSLMWCFSLLAMLYVTATTANYFNNSKSIQKVPDSILRTAVIGGGPHIISFYENAGCLQRAVDYYNARGDYSTASSRYAFMETYVQRAALEIVRDPVEFKRTLVPGRQRYVPEYLWND